MNEPQDLRNKLNQETASIAWKDLQTFYAHGSCLWVDDSLSLLDVAMVMHEDNSQQLKAWLEAQQVRQQFDDIAVRYVEEDASVWALVLSPWVLIQDIQSK